jgi:hypothetical protein
LDTNEVVAPAAVNEARETIGAEPLADPIAGEYPELEGDAT